MSRTLNRVLLVDNYDSFTWNLVQLLQELGAQVVVRRNDQVDQSDLDEVTHLMVSPGPGRPEAAGRSVDMVRAAMGRMPVLGVCLGHQSIAVALGAGVDYAARLMHGKTSEVYHDDRTLFRGMPNPFLAGRYHSLVVRMPDESEMEVSARTQAGEIMGLRHRELSVEGVQFHPESILTPDGRGLLMNFLTKDAR